MILSPLNGACACYAAGAMAFTLTSAQRIALTVSLFGLLAFLLGVIAENKKVCVLYLLYEHLPVLQFVV